MRRNLGALQATQKELEAQQAESRRLMLNILPAVIAKEIHDHKTTEPRYYASATILFSDIVGCTQIAEGMAPRPLVDALDNFFAAFDDIAARFNIEKLKTIGDSYMCAAGLPEPNVNHAIDACLAALSIRAFLLRLNKDRVKFRLKPWEMRIGLHSGPVVAGIIGKQKFYYDVWGKTVNIASRMESAGEPNRVNISGCTYEAVKHLFECEDR